MISNIELWQTKLFCGHVFLSHRNGRARSLQDKVTNIMDHSHFSDSADIYLQKFRTALKIRAAVADEPTQTQFFPF